MGRKKTTVAPQADEGDSILNSDVFSSVEDVEDEQEGLLPPSQINGDDNTEDVEEPLMESPDWSDFVMKQFTNEELDNLGNPCVHGLRRVARKLLGPIVCSSSRVVQSPVLLCPTSMKRQPAVCEHKLVILWTRLEGGELQSAYQVEFSDVGDVSETNTDPDFCRFATATAATRAEARAYRKALQLHRVSSEETTMIPVEEGEVKGNITSTQINFLQILCSRNDINLWVYVNMGKIKFLNINEIPFETANAMIEHLSGMQDKPETINPKYKGYDPNWRESQKNA